MKLIILAISVLCNCIAVQAQRFDTTFYPEMKDWDPMFVKHGDAFYAFDIEMKGISGFSANLKRSMHNITLVKYDAEMKETKKEKVVAPDKAFGPVPPSLKVVNDKLYLVFFKLSEKKTVTIYAAGINPSTLELSEPNELLSFEEDIRYLEFHMRSLNAYDPNHTISRGINAGGLNQFHKTFFFESSPDGSKYVLAWTSGWDGNFFFSILDKNMKKIRTGHETFIEETSLAFFNACIDNNGNAYFSYSYNSSGKDFAEILINKKEGSSEVKEITIPGGNAFGAYAVLDKVKGNLLICGAYQEGDSYLAGVYILSLNTADLTLGTASKTAFPKDLAEIFDKEGWGNGKEKKIGLSDGLVMEANMLDNGVLNLIGEFRRSITGYKFVGSILNARFNGNTVVFSRIPKIRVDVVTTSGDSYRAFVYRNTLVILYNDILSNLNLDLSKTPARPNSYSRPVMAAVVLGSDGSVKREIVIDKSKEDYLVSLETMQEMAPGNYFLIMRRIKTFGKMTSDIKWVSLSIK